MLIFNAGSCCLKKKNHLQKVDISAAILEHIHQHHSAILIHFHVKRLSILQNILSAVDNLSSGYVGKILKGRPKIHQK